MFKHFKTNKLYYSVREKINYYKKVISGKVDADSTVKRKAKLRLKTLTKINTQSYDEPRLIVTNDYHFGNSSKPRLCVAYGEDNKNRIKVFPIHKRTIKTIIIDNNLDRQIDPKYVPLDKSDVYELKYIFNVKPLSKGTRQMIKHIHK